MHMYAHDFLDVEAETQSVVFAKITALQRATRKALGLLNRRTPRPGQIKEALGSVAAALKRFETVPSHCAGNGLDLLDLTRTNVSWAIGLPPPERYSCLTESPRCLDPHFRPKPCCQNWNTYHRNDDGVPEYYDRDGEVFSLFGAPPAAELHPQFIEDIDAQAGLLTLLHMKCVRAAKKLRGAPPRQAEQVLVNDIAYEYERCFKQKVTVSNTKAMSLISDIVLVVGASTISVDYRVKRWDNKYRKLWRMRKDRLD